MPPVIPDLQLRVAELEAIVQHQGQMSLIAVLQAELSVLRRMAPVPAQLKANQEDVRQDMNVSVIAGKREEASTRTHMNAGP